MDQAKGGQEHFMAVEIRNGDMEQLQLDPNMDESLARICRHNQEVKSALAQELVKLGLSEKCIKQLLNIGSFKNEAR